jgi:putative transport protein
MLGARWQKPWVAPQQNHWNELGLRVRRLGSLRRQGLQLNVLAAAVVLLGGLIAACFRGLSGFSIPAVAGTFSGATTNTPSLAAAQAVLQGFKDQSSNNTDLLGTAYAVAYPFGIIGIILAMLLIRKVRLTLLARADLLLRSVQPLGELPRVPLGRAFS